jgi:hypothetical protein
MDDLWQLTLTLDAGEARPSQGCIFKEERRIVFWWGLIAFTVALSFLLFWLFRWTSKDPGVTREIEKDRFRAEQDWRALRRSGKSD